MYPVHPRTAVLETMGNDLANHARHVYEAGLALREGQFPPLVAPEINGRVRLPVFQYYSGTSYLLPATANAIGLQPYRALKIGVFVHVLAAGVFMYAACKALGVEPTAALVAATAYQLAPFSSADFYARGSYTQFVSLHTAPVVLYCALRLVQSSRRWDGVLWLCLTGLAAGYYIPLHPVQAVMGGTLIGAIVLAHALIDRRASWPALARLAGAGALALAASSWFWVPIARDYRELQIVAHGTFLDAGMTDPAVLLWPTFRETPEYPWAPQVGLHFVVAAVVVVALWKDTRAAGVTAALVLLVIVVVVLFHTHLPLAQRVLKPLQWSHRLLIPATTAGALCLALELSAVVRRVRDPWAQGAAFGVAMAYVLAVSAPYFLGQRPWVYTSRVRNVLAPGWQAPNSAVYSLRGTDYRRLEIVRADGTLNVNTDLTIPPEGFPTEVRIVLRRPARPQSLGVRVGTSPAELPYQGVAEPEEPSHVRLAFTFSPRAGFNPGRPSDTVIRFDAPESATDWPVDDLTFRATADPADLVCRLPSAATRTDTGAQTSFHVDVDAGREGMYQLPVCMLPSSLVTVNGTRVAPTPSVNRLMVTVPLRAGRNEVTIRTRAAPVPAIISGAVVLTMIACTAALVVGRLREKQFSSANE